MLKGKQAHALKFIQQNNASEYIKNKVIQSNMSVLPDEVTYKLLLKDDVRKT